MPLLSKDMNMNINMNMSWDMDKGMEMCTDMGMDRDTGTHIYMNTYKDQGWARILGCSNF
jgi:hypothetical protein